MCVCVCVLTGLASDPSGPLYAGEMQMTALGMDVDVADPETGKSIRHVSNSLFLTGEY